MLAAEPQATAERRAQLMIEAKAQVRAPDLYWDATFSVSKSISLFHASALANAAAAARRGDLAAARTWQEVADGIWDGDHGGQCGRAGVLAARGGADPGRVSPGRAVGGRPRLGDRLVPSAHLPRR